MRKKSDKIEKKLQNFVYCENNYIPHIEQNNLGIANLGIESK
jgi:hypothetical protein